MKNLVSSFSMMVALGALLVSTFAFGNEMTIDQDPPTCSLQGRTGSIVTLAQEPSSLSHFISFAGALGYGRTVEASVDGGYRVRTVYLTIKKGQKVLAQSSLIAPAALALGSAPDARGVKYDIKPIVHTELPDGTQVTCEFSLVAAYAAIDGK